MKRFFYLVILSFFFISCASTGSIEKAPKINPENKRLIALFRDTYAGYKDMVAKGFDIHSLDYITNFSEFSQAVLPYLINEDGTCMDNHLWIENLHNLKYQRINFSDKFGTKEELLSQGYIENETMFYYPSNGEKNWRVGRKYISSKSPTSNYTGTKHFDFSNYGNCSIITFYYFEDNDNYSEMISSIKKNKSKYIVVNLADCRGGSVERVNYLLNSSIFSNKKVYVITSNFTGSAAERFTLFLKKKYNAIQVGNSTSGTVAYGLKEELNNISFPNLRINILMLPTNKFTDMPEVKESIGLSPDFWAITSRDIKIAIELDSPDIDY